MIAGLKELYESEEGQGLPEYALLVAAVVVMVVGVASLFAVQVDALFSQIGTYISTNASTAT